MSAFALVWMIFFLPETLYDNILLRRAQRIRKRTGDETIRSQSEVEMGTLSISRTVTNQIVADFRMSFADPIILFVNLHTMLIYGVLYLWFEFFPFGKNIYITKLGYCTDYDSLRRHIRIHASPASPYVFYILYIR